MLTTSSAPPPSSSSPPVPPPPPTTSSSAPSSSFSSAALPPFDRSPSASPFSCAEVVAVPIWQDGAGTSMKQQPLAMEPIPEDEEEGVISPSTSFVGQSVADDGHPSAAAPIPPPAAQSPQNGSYPPHSSPTVTSGGMEPEGGVAKRITESKRRLREVYTTEEVDTLVSTLPKESVPVEWEHFSAKEFVVDPKMAHTYVTELAGGIPSARGTKYSYTYESRVEEEGQNDLEQNQRRREEGDEEMKQPITELRREEEEHELGREVRRSEDGMERHCTSTQKITRVTKITTTRQVKQIPVNPADVYFDADGNPILNGFDAQNISADSGPDEEEFGTAMDASVGIDLSRTYISESEQYFSSPQTSSTAPQGSQSVSPPGGSGKYFFTATPGAPGLPEVTELTDSTIALAWLRPEFDGTAGPLIGYRVEFRRSEFDEWDPAHDDLLGETECKITNLDADECYQFRVLGANIAGFGTPSSACAPIRLRRGEQWHTTSSANGILSGTTADGARDQSLLPPPVRPRVVALDADRATIEWQPTDGMDGEGAWSDKMRNGGWMKRSKGDETTAKYVVEYRAVGSSEWTPANNRGPITEHTFTISNLRPNGEYEFRVLATDSLGRYAYSPSSDIVRIRPSVPLRQQSLRQQRPSPPGQPKLLESGPSWVHLCWEQPTQLHQSLSDHGPIAYLVELRQLLVDGNRSDWMPLKEQRVDGVAQGDEQQTGTESTVFVTTSLGHFIVENLSLADNAFGYEFRVWAVSLVNGLRSAAPSPVSAPIRLRSDWPTPSDQLHSSANRRPPERPSAPEYLEYSGGTTLTLCWLPAKSVLPVQGYEVEFRDIMQDAAHWYRMTDQLVRACKTSVGYLLNGHQYQFRIIAKNSAGLSDPSDPSPLIAIDAEDGAGRSDEHQMTAFDRHIGVPLTDEIVRESPPLPDRDDSPPPIYRQTESSLQWRDPTLKEVIDYLKSPDPTLVLDASGYLEHLTFNNDLMKEETRNYGGIECLVSLLRSSNPEILRNVCGCLKNLAFGRANDGNKRLINTKGGVKALTQLLRQANVPLTVQEEATAALWNISSADELKESVLNQAAETVVTHIVLPTAAHLCRSLRPQLNAPSPSALPSAASSNARNSSLTVFRNGVGILRNISAVNDSARRFLRSAPGLVDALLDFLEGAVQRTQLDNRPVENVVCLLRNLSYRVQEVVDPKYDPNRPRYQMHGADGRIGGPAAQQQGKQTPVVSTRTERSRSAPAGSPKTASGKKGRLFRRAKKDTAETADSAIGAIPPATGPQRLWHPNTVKLYLRVLQESADSEILEASTAALQNLAGCPFDGSALVRQTVRTEKGLPVLVELLRLKEDRVVSAVCCALRNLALDQRNLELIGKYALVELLAKLPDRTELDRIRAHPSASPIASDATVGAVLGILWEAVRHSAELARAVHETTKGTERLRTVAKSYPTHGRRVCKYATQVLFMMWQHKELHEMFRREGLVEADFYSGTLHRGGTKGGAGGVAGEKQQQNNCSSSSPSSVATTLARPFSSQGIERPANLIGLDTPPRTNGSGADSNHYGTLTPSQPIRFPPLSSADSHLYASVQKENGRSNALTANRRRSIDSWV